MVSVSCASLNPRFCGIVSSHDCASQSSFALDYWNEGASQLIELGVPKLDFKLDLWRNMSWPQFHQPRLSVQLSLGALFTALQYVQRFLKAWLRQHHAVLLMPTSEPLRMEVYKMRVLSAISWAPFGFAMDLCKSAFEATGSKACQHIFGRNDSKDLSIRQRTMSLGLRLAYAAFFGLGTVTLIIPGYFAFMESFVKVFSDDDGDDEVLSFCKSEGSMSYKRIRFSSSLEETTKEQAPNSKSIFKALSRRMSSGDDHSTRGIGATTWGMMPGSRMVIRGNERVTQLSLLHISHKCVWITDLDLSFCSSSSLGTLEPLSMLTQLRELRAKGCTGLVGDVKHLSWLVLLVVLDLSRTRIAGNIRNLTRLAKLEHLDLSRTAVEGDVWSLSSQVNLKVLDLRRTKVDPEKVKTFRELKHDGWANFEARELKAAMAVEGTKVERALATDAAGEDKRKIEVI